MTQTTATLGLDVGGAGLKASLVSGTMAACWSGARRFPLWREPSKLADELRILVKDRSFDCLALTMTGELCDAFETKAQGVQQIIEQTQKAFPQIQLHVWQTTGQFVDPEQAIADPWRTAASNWLALAEWIARQHSHDRLLLVDVGSTTTDIIPIDQGRVVSLGRTDPDRLAARELLYRGVRRTPIAAVIDRATIDGITYPMMAELFATTLDAYLVLEMIPPDPSAHDTADGRPETVPCSIDRLARMIGSDRSRFGLSEARQLAEQVWRAHALATTQAIDHVLHLHGLPADTSIIVSGEGEWFMTGLNRMVPIQRPMTSFARDTSPTISRGACAWAVARLLHDRRSATDS
jgi:probable H4MPT-linked C1 transfer pathway protein